MTSTSRLTLTAAVAALTVMAAPVLADTTLPAPYVSHALDAVLLPIDAGVRSAFALAPDDKGVLVLATAPKGVAEQAGIVPGDVISIIEGRAVTSPVELDAAVLYFIGTGLTDIPWRVWRGGGWVEVTTVVTEATYWETLDLSTLSTWSSWSSESFSWEEYSVEYSEEITTTWEESQTLIEETMTSEEFTSEMSETTEETTSEETTTEETSSEETNSEEVATEEASAEESATEEAADEATDEAAEDMADASLAAEGEDDPAGDEAAADEGADDADAGDEGGTEADAGDTGDEEADAGDDGMADDGGDADMGDEGGGDEGGSDEGGSDAGGDGA